MNLIKVGAFVAECRKAKDLTQKELADKLGVTDSAVSKWERGSSLPDVTLMKPLCETLNITLNELLDGERIASEKERAAVAEKQIIGLIKDKGMSLKKLRMISVIVAAVLSVVGISVPAIVNSAVNGNWFVSLALPIIAVSMVILWASVYVGFFMKFSWWIKSAIFAGLVALGNFIIDPLTEYLIGGQFRFFNDVSSIVIISVSVVYAIVIIGIYFGVIKKQKR